MRKSEKDTKTRERTLEESRKKITEIIIKLKEEVSQKLNFNPDEILDNLTTLAFAPTPYMLSVLVSKTLYNVTQKIENIEGYSVNKKHVNFKIKQLENIPNYNIQTFNKIKNEELEIKILDLKSLFDNYSHQFPLLKSEFENTVSKYKKDFRNLSNTLEKYFQDIETLHNKIIETEQLQDHISILKNQLNKNIKPSFTDIYTYNSDYYYTSVQDILKELDEINRAYWFHTLRNENLFDFKILNVGHENFSSNLHEIESKIDARIREYLTSKKTPPSKSPDSPDASHKSEISGEIVTIKDIYIINLLREYKTFKYVIDPDIHFKDKAEVRVHRIRVWIEGATTQNGQLKVKITHPGDEKMYNTKGEKFEFKHHPRPANFRYTLKDKTIHEPGNFGIKNNKEGDYALYGPFTKWKIDLNENQGLNLDNVKEVKIDFHISYYNIEE